MEEEKSLFPVLTSNKKSYDADFLDDENYIKILKANSIIRGRMTPDNNKMKLTAYDNRVLNFLLRTLQECIKKDSQPIRHTTIVVPMEIFKKVVDSSQNWRTNFIKSVEKLERVGIRLNNYKDWNSGNYVLWKQTRLVLSPSFEIEGKERKRAICRITFPEEISTACWQKMDYTHLDFKTLNSFTSKYAIRFYESLVSKIQYCTNFDNYKTEYDFYKEELESIFEVDFNKINTTFVRFLINSVGFEKIIIPDLKSKLNFEHEIHSKDMIISFKFNKSDLEQFRTKKADLVDLSIKKFKDLIDSEKIFDDGDERIYEINTEQPENAMVNFLEKVRKYYSNIPLLQREEEIEQFGNIAMNSDGDLYYLDSYKKISYGRSKKFLIYLYKNYYEYIMSRIEKTKAGFFN